MNRSRGRRGRARGSALVLLLGALTALAPATIDAYLPALPAIGRELPGASVSTQLTLAASLLGLALGQLVGGTISDRVGRRRPLLLGLVGYALASLACALAPSVELLLAGRLVAGATAGGGVAIARACALDRSRDERDSARLFSTLMLIAGIAPMLAPLAGGALLGLAGWRAIFLSLAALAGCLFAATLVLVPEPRARAREATLGADLGALLRSRSFRRHARALACASASLFAYIAMGPGLFEAHYGLSPLGFSALFAANAAGLVGASFLNRRLLRRFGPRALSAAGFALMGAAAIASLVLFTVEAPLPLLAATLFAEVAPIGLLLPNVAALAMDGQRLRAGTASAQLGFVQFGVGAAVSPLGASIAVAMAVPLAAAILGLAALAAVRPFNSSRGPREAPATAPAPPRPGDAARRRAATSPPR